MTKRLYKKVSILERGLDGCPVEIIRLISQHIKDEYQFLSRVRGTSSTLLSTIDTIYRTIVNMGYDMSGRLKSSSMVLFPNIKYLDLSRTDHKISFYGGLYHLSNMTSLRLENISSLYGVGNDDLALVTQLRSLSLRNNRRITDSGIQSLTNLTHLNIAFNSIITSLIFHKLPNLVDLCVSSERWTYIQRLSELYKLTSLTILHDCNYAPCVIDDSVISTLTNLSILHIYGENKITDVGLEGMTRLTNLRISSITSTIGTFVEKMPLLVNLLVVAGDDSLLTMETCGK